MNSSRGTILRVVLVLLVSLGLLGTLIYYSVQSFDRFTTLVDKLNQQRNWQARVANDIVIDISELDRLARTYQLTLSSSDLTPYLQKVDELSHSIDTLYQGSFGTEYHDEVDTLSQVFAEKVSNFEALIQFKISQSSLQDDISALELLADSRDEILTDSMLIPTREVTTTTVTTSNQDSIEKKGLISRIFGGKEKEVPQREMMQERTVAYDSAYFEKVDTMMASVETALRAAESQRRYEQRLLANRELQIASNDLRIIDKLKSIAAEIERLNEEMLHEQRIKAVNQAEAALNQVLFWVICGGVLTILFTVWVVRDIFESVRLQRELEVSKLKAEKLASSREEFLANMSHELRTPLNSIIGFTGQIYDEVPRAGDKIDRLRKSSEHVLRIVNDILDYSRIESGKLPIERTGFKPRQILQECLEMISFQAETKDLEIACDLAENTEDLIVEGDPLRLKQILINLTNNAIKFTSQGRVGLELRAEDVGKGEVTLHFAVMDTGKGISPDRLERIFESFDQEDASINRKYGGTGLGLSISRKLIHLQGGKLEVESTPGKGSRFSFWLKYPRAESDEYGTKSQPESAELDLSGRSLLLVDDDEMNHILLKPVFKKWGLDFESAFTASEAMTALNGSNFDFVLVDMKLPDRSGAELITELNEKDDGPLDFKLFLCTANPLINKQHPETLEEVDGLLLKPFKEFEIAKLLAGDQSLLNSSPQESMKLDYTLDNFRKFAGFDQQILRKFIESFIKTNKQNLELLHQYHEDEDLYALADIAHKMKNTYGQLEAERIVKRLVVLENPLEKLSEKQRKQTVSEIKDLSAKLFTGLEKDLSEMD
jgi:signal transduction histidine kinase/response regulator of citrate/malate metabolism